jgi:hypothetical protein
MGITLHSPPIEGAPRFGDEFRRGAASSPTYAPVLGNPDPMLPAADPRWSGLQGGEDGDAEGDRDDAGELESRDPLAEEQVGGECRERGELRGEDCADGDAVPGADCVGGEASDLAEPGSDHERECRTCETQASRCPEPSEYSDHTRIRSDGGRRSPSVSPVRRPSSSPRSRARDRTFWCLCCYNKHQIRASSVCACAPSLCVREFMVGGVFLWQKEP